MMFLHLKSFKAAFKKCIESFQFHKNNLICVTSESWENSFSKWFKMVGISPENLYYIILYFNANIT